MTTKSNVIFLLKFSQFYGKKGKFWIFLSSVNFTIFSNFLENFAKFSISENLKKRKKES